MEILSLHLQNFMRYDQADIAFGPGFTAIVGPSDMGKSTILRALTWVFYNKPAGMDMCRTGTDQTEVRLKFSRKGHVRLVTRHRSKKRNAYCLDGQWFDAVKTDVPVEVQEALGVHLAELGPKIFEPLNISRQMDGPFLLTASAGDAAKVVGNVSGITIIDQALASIRPDLLGQNKELSHYQKMQEHYTLASQEFTDLDREGQQLERAQRLLRTAQEHQARVDQLQLVAQRMEQYNQTIATISQDIDRRELLLAKVAPWVAQATQTLRLVEARQLLWDQLDNYSYAYEQNKQYQEEALQRLAHLQADYATCLQESGTCPMCGVRVAEGRHEG